MRLTDLEPRLIRYDAVEEMADMVPVEYRGLDNYDAWVAAGRPFVKELTTRIYHVDASDLDTAQGVIFLCPLCFQKNGGAEGTHSVMVPFDGRGVPAGAGSMGTNGPSRWTASGRSLETLSTVPSILLLPPGCGWHGYITDGDVTFV